MGLIYKISYDSLTTVFYGFSILVRFNFYGVGPTV